MAVYLTGHSPCDTCGSHRTHSVKVNHLGEPIKLELNESDTHCPVCGSKIWRLQQKKIENRQDLIRQLSTITKNK